MGGIFRTFGNTWSITKTSMSVLRKDKELLFFPFFAAIGVLIIAGIAAAILVSMGTFDRLDTAGEDSQLKAGDIIVGVLAIVAAMFVINYFNAALMGAARHRLRGGDPNVWTGFAAVNKHIGAVFGWSVISAIIFILLTYIRGKTDSFLGRMLVDIVGAERVIAGSDCGFGTFAGFGAVDPDIAYAKLSALSEGAAIASGRL